MTYYKVLNHDATSCHGGTVAWHKPKGKRPGKWMPKIEVIEPCLSGYHLCRREDLVLWLGPAIYEAEARGEVMETGDKVVAQEARLLRRLDTWNERTARLFACDCAERVLHLTTDERSHEAVRVARRYAVGDATDEELDAAWASARAAAWDAAWASARAWQTERLFQYLNGEVG
jgi:hypothetical protein